MRRYLLAFTVAIGLALGLTSSVSSQGPVVLRKSTGEEAGTSTNPIRVDGTGTTPQPVTGTFWQATQPVSGTFWQATQPVSGTFWQATQPVSGTFFQATQPVSTADGAQVTLGAKADAKSTATDTTAITIMSVLKQISASVQGTLTVASHAVTNAGTFLVQAAQSGTWNITNISGTVSLPTGAATQTTLAALAADPCGSNAKTTAVFSISSGTTTQLVAASASNKLYVCSFHIIAGAANNVSLVEDDTAACASPTAGMAGGTTAATGWNFAANGGIALGSGSGSVMQTAATNRYVCLITSGAAQTSGTLSYVLAP